MMVLRLLACAGVGALLGLTTISCMKKAPAEEEEQEGPGRRRGPPHGRVTMCHIPPMDPASAETIQVNRSDLMRHMARGDRIGPCTEEELACTPLGARCGDDDECCTLSCFQGSCNPTCHPSGESCDSNADCCSETCSKGVCVEA